MPQWLSFCAKRFADDHRLNFLWIFNLGVLSVQRIFSWYFHDNSEPFKSFYLPFEKQHAPVGTINQQRIGWIPPKSFFSTRPLILTLNPSESISYSNVIFFWQGRNNTKFSKDTIIKKLVLIASQRCHSRFQAIKSNFFTNF